VTAATQRRHPGAPAFDAAETGRAAAESSPYTIRHTEPITGPAPCTACGTTVTVVWERPWHTDDNWRPMAWELHSGGARHTTRRCTWHTTRTAPAGQAA
jgi:hypothetical protein